MRHCRGHADDIVLETADGSLTINGSILGDGASGNVLLITNEAAEGTDASIYQNASLTASGNFDISLISPDAILQNADGDITASTTECSTIDLQAVNAITQTDGTEVNAITQTDGTDGDIRLFSSAAGDLTIGLLGAGTGGVALQNASGSLLDTADASVADVQSSGLLMEVSGDVASAANPLEISSETLSVLSSAGAAGIFISESDALSIDRVDVTIERVSLDGSSAAIATENQEDLRANAGGIFLQLLDGSLTINDGDLAADNTGVSAALNILLQTSEVAEGGAANSNLVLNAQVVSTSGSISLAASDEIVQNTDTGDVVTQAAGKTIDLLADDGIRQVDGASAITNTGDTFLTTTSGDIVFGQVLALGANVVLQALSGSILDLDTDTNEADIRTNGLVLFAGTNIGSGSNHLETEVSTLSTRSGGSAGTFVSELDALNVIESGASVERIGADAQVASTPSLTQSDLESSNDGAIVVVSGGALTLDEGNADDEVINASGNVLLQTTSEAITVNAPVFSAGNVRIDSAAAITQSASGEITLSSSAKTLYARATVALIMADGAFAQSTDGDIRYESTNGDITLGQLIAGAGNVALKADTGSIIDGGDTGGEDVQSAGLLITAGTNIASGTNHLETLVARLSTLSSTAAFSDGSFITESNGLIVDSVTVAVQTIESDGLTPVATTDVTQADLDTTSGGAIVVQVSTGNFQLTDGASSDADGIAVASVSNVLLDAQNGQLIVDADMISASGHLDLQASDDIVLGSEADLSTQSSGQTILLTSDSDVLMSDGASIDTTDGNLVVQATDSITVGDFAAGTAFVGLRGSTITDSGSSDTDVTAAQLRLEAESATGAAGESTNHLEINVDVLSAQTGSGGVFVTETDALQVGTVPAISANRIGSDGSAASTVTEASQEDVTTGGALVIDVTTGDLTVNGGDDTSALIATDHLRLSTTSGNIAINALAVSTTGSIYVDASASVTQAAAGSLQTNTTDETIYVLAGGAITMTDGSTAQTTNGSMRYEANGGDVTVAQLLAGTGDSAVIATAGSVLDIAGDANDEDIRSSGLLISASGNIGTGSDHLETSVDTLSTQSGGSAGNFISESNSVTVGSVSVDVNVVSSAAQNSNLNALQDALEASPDGSIVLVTATGGTITLSSNVTANDNILIQAQDEELIANEIISSATGHISLLASEGILLGAASKVNAEGSEKTIDISAGAGVAMTDGAEITSNNGNVRILAEQAIELGSIDAGTASVSLKGSTIIDSGDAENDIRAASLRLEATATTGAVGAGDNHLEMDVDVLSVSAGSGGIFLTEADGLVVDTIPAVDVNRIAQDATIASIVSDAAQSDLITEGRLVTIVNSGNLTINGGGDASGIMASNNVLLSTLVGDMTLAAGLTSERGHVSLLSEGNLQQFADGDILLEGNGKTLYAKIAHAITMSDGAVSETTNGDIRYEAKTGDITLSQLIASSADIAVLADQGSILDLATDTNDADLLASGLLLTAGGSMGESNNLLDIDVAVLSADASSEFGIFLDEVDALQIDRVAVSVKEIDEEGLTLIGVVDAVQEDAASQANFILLTGSDLEVTEGGDSDGLGVQAVGNILLSSQAGLTLDSNADVYSTTGDISLLANSGKLIQNVMADVVADLGTIEAFGSTGITMDDNARAVATADIFYLSGGDITVGGIEATTGIFVVTQTGRILDGGDTYVDFVAYDLRLLAQSIGLLGTNSIETSVTTLTARSGGGGMDLLETNGLTVDDVTVSINRVLSTAAVEAIDFSAYTFASDLTTQDNGSIILRTTTDDLTFNDGTAPANDAAVTANGSGQVLLEAIAGSIILAADVRSTSGVLTFRADTGIDFQDQVRVVSANDVSLLAANGAITMNGTALVAATDASARLESAGNLTVGNVVAEDVSFVSGGAILNAANSTKNVTATNLRIESNGSVSEALNHLMTDVDNLSVYSATGSLFLTEDDGVTVRDVSVSAREFTAAATNVTVLDPAQSDLATGVDGDIVLVAKLGDLTIEDGADADGVGVSADGLGNIFLSTDSERVILAADVISETGLITLDGHSGSELQDGVNVTTAADISMTAEKGPIVMSGTSNISATDSSLRLFAANALTVGNLTAADISLVSMGAIINAAGSTKNATATNLRIESNGSVGSASNYLSSDVELLSASSATGSIFIREDNGLTVLDVMVVAEQFDATGSVATVADSAQSDLSTGVNGEIILLSTTGNVVLTDGADADETSVTANGSGRILIDALSGSLTANADLLSGSGVITLAASQNLELTAGVAVSTAADISLDAEGGGLTMSGTAAVTATDASARLSAAQTLTIGNVIADNVSLFSRAAIVNAEGSTKNVTATNLRIEATGSVGTAARHVSTDMDNLSAASTTGSIYLTEDDAVAVTSVSVSVTELTSTAATTLVTDLAQSDLTTGANGDIILVATTGDLTLTDGANTDDTAVSANGIGRILIDAAGGSLTANADILSTSGMITLSAAQDLGSPLPPSPSRPLPPSP